MPKPTDKSQSEAKIQQESVMLFRNEYCLKTFEKPSLIFSVPLEACQMNWTKYEQTGALAGTSDLIGFKYKEIPFLTHYQPFFAETKMVGQKQSPSQIKFEEHCRKMGLPYFVYRSKDEFSRVVEKL